MPAIRASKSWLLTPVLVLSLLGCGDDESPGPSPEATPDAGGGEGSEPGGESGGGNEGEPSNDPPAPLLEDGVVGIACAQGSDCLSMGTCEMELTGGSTTRVLGTQPIPTPDGYCTATCETNEQCGEGGVCFGAVQRVAPGECRKTCESQDDCRQGYECAKLNVEIGVPIPNSCQPAPVVDSLGADEAGALCSEDADCPNGRCSMASGVGLCTGTCVTDADCGAGGQCVTGLYGAAGYCVEACESDDDCQNAAQGWGCPAEGERRTCQRKLVDGVVGNSCTVESEQSDCPGGSCRDVAYGAAYPEGYCIGDCSTDADCGTGGVCIDGSVCLKGCAAASDCREGYECIAHPVATVTTEPTICYPVVPDMAGADAGTPPAADAGTADP